MSAANPRETPRRFSAQRQPGRPLSSEAIQLVISGESSLLSSIGRPRCEESPAVQANEEPGAEVVTRSTLRWTYSKGRR